jgi:release factor glutamine methyltransferase
MRLADWLTQATARLIEAGIEPDEARVEVRLLAEKGLDLTRTQLFLRTGERIDPAALEPLLKRREAREPLAYILGTRAFYGRNFIVTPDVLIPRPETELLVETALAHFFSPSFALRNAEKGEGRGRGMGVADIGTGSGCIAVTLAKHLPGAQVFATDLSEAALDVARLNASRETVDNVTFHRGDLLAPLPDGLLFDAIVSNPPYISRAEAETLAPEVLAEPHAALFDAMNSDGLGFYRRLAVDAPGYLVSGGLLAVEVGQGQAEPVAQLFTEAGFIAVETLPDLAGILRVVRGTHVAGAACGVSSCR